MTLTLAVPRTMTNKRESIRALMEHYQDFRTESAGVGGAGLHRESRRLQFDTRTWTPAYKELERILDELRALAHGPRPMIARGVSSSAAWWHLKERYIVCRVERRLMATVKDKRGQRHVPRPKTASWEILNVQRKDAPAGKAWVLRVVWHPDVEMVKVDAALDWIADRYRGVPALPKEMVA